MSLRIIFMGTPEFSVPILSALLTSDHHVVAVYTQPPRPAGRGKQEKRSPVDDLASGTEIPVFTPANLANKGDQEIFKNHDADIGVVVSYGLILPQAILQAPKQGCLNVHTSLLPRWRGAAPIERAIMAGDQESGVVIMQVEEGLDSGPICLCERIKIGENMTSGELRSRLSHLGVTLIIDALDALSQGGLNFTPQETEGVTYAKKIEKSEARIDWSQNARQLHNHIRGLSPTPGAWAMVPFQGTSQRVKVLASELILDPEFCEKNAQPGEVMDANLTIRCGQGALRLAQLQRAGKKPMAADIFLRGFPVRSGDLLD